MENNQQRPSKGLHTDNAFYDSPKETYRFALNAVNETELGDFNFIGNEESNEECAFLKNGYTPIGKVYTIDNEVVIFSVSQDETVSEIGILKDNCEYKTYVNDATSIGEEKLGFKLSKQIDAAYRLRRGCEKTVYFTDNNSKPRYYNFSKPDQFKTSGRWDSIKFSLFKVYSQIPVFEKVELEENGNLPPGSYNAAIQYLDEDLNPTEWIISSETILIYNDNFSKNYPSIRGSTNLVTNYQNFGNTNKSIKLTFSNLDRSFPFYRVAIIEANTGSGMVSDVKISQEISTDINTFNYTGAASIESTTTEEEILMFNSVIQKAESIEQIENRLLLANTKGKQIDYCKLQKYASRIKTDVTTKEIILNSLTESNPKSGTVHFDGTGYMPGEMYSFGIVYIFKDNTVSPVYHIPGKNTKTENQIFSPGPKVKPMSIDNVLQDTFYTDNSDCIDYWGYDSEGEPLGNTPIRHHRFPLRSEIALPLIREGFADGSNSSSSENIPLEQLIIDITGVISPTYTEETISIVIEYEIDGNISTYETTINTNTYDSANGITLPLTTSSNTITFLNVYENGNVVSGTSTVTDLSYTSSIVNSTLSLEDTLYTSEILGIKFSGIDLPSDIDTNGEEIIGYYIVRNPRDEDNKSILDTGVLTPLMDETQDGGYFVAHGLTFPDFENGPNKIKTDAVALIHPEHRFSFKEYKQTTKLIREGSFNVSNVALSSVVTQDVMAGTSFDPETSKRREQDSDGFSLHTLTRDNKVDYKKLSASNFNDNDIAEVFYLDALFSKPVEDSQGRNKEIFNTSGDNKIGIVTFNKSFNVNEIYRRIPYVVMKRDLSNAYANFRVLDYYKEGNNPTRFIKNSNGDLISGTEATVFGGDTYISPMRYFSSTFYDIRLRKRDRKNAFVKFLISVVSIVAGILIIAGTIGLGAPAGIAAIGFGISQFAAGLKIAQMNKIYSELYDAGLRNAVDDFYTNFVFGKNPKDDEVQWVGEGITNLWFESTANVALRQGTTVSIPDFLNAPANMSVPGTIVYPNASPINDLDEYMLEKLTSLDAENANGRLYQGFANAELYEINKDYRRRNRQKVFTHLGIEYDCCSDCTESFPHRIYYSEQSFQEELTDNFRTFLPNNYRDIEGETGVVTDLFKISNNLFIHTEEALWQLPKNYQERVTDQIVSFIGTGSYFEIPPQKLVDDATGSSGGNQHKWGTIKTPHGVFFISENQRKVYRFDGRQLKAISNIGESNWFKENTALKINEQYYQSNEDVYPYDDNPSNLYGTGFLSTYDTKKERVIISKKDFTLSNEVVSNSDFEICVNNGQFILFENFSTTVENMENQGWSYTGIEDCRLRFEKTVLETRLEERELVTGVPNTADVWVMLDMSGSFDASDRQNIIDSVNFWATNYANDNPDWTGTVHIYQNPNADNSERWINCLQYVLNSNVYSGVSLSEVDIVLVSFVNESIISPGNVYHADDIVDPLDGPYQYFLDDRASFITLYSQFKSFYGITYPIVDPSVVNTKAFLQHSLAALKGTNYTVTEIDAITPNPGLESWQWGMVRNSLITNNPYPDDGLENYGWVGQWDRTGSGDGTVITPIQFQEDIDTLLQGFVTIETIQVEVQVATTQVTYIDGVTIVNPLDLNVSWTKSFSLKSEMWISYHSYLPSFYVNVPEKFYSWIPNTRNNAFWKHNVKGSYQTFYGEYKPHILEYVSLSNPMVTRVWNHIRLITEAKKYNSNMNQYTEERFVTFNKMVLYNSRQCSGEMDLVVKDTQANQENYMMNQVSNLNNNSFIIDRNEKDWTVNDLRDIRVDYTNPIWDSSVSSVQPNYFIDKILNTSTLNINKDWTQLESFRDKYLVIRLIFDKFADIKLLTNYSVENEQQSFR